MQPDIDLMQLTFDHFVAQLKVVSLISEVFYVPIEFTTLFPGDFLLEHLLALIMNFLGDPVKNSLNSVEFVC